MTEYDFIELMRAKIAGQSRAVSKYHRHHQVEFLLNMNASKSRRSNPKPNTNIHKDKQDCISQTKKIEAKASTLLDDEKIKDHSRPSPLLLLESKYKWCLMMFNNIFNGT